MTRSKTPALPSQAHGEPAVQRANGVARLQVGVRPDATGPAKTVVERLYQAGSAKIRFSAAQADTGLTAVLINTAGGLTGGDQFEWGVDLNGGANCTVLTQACEKVYRSDGGSADVSIGLAVGRGARLDWLPQETILFDGADLNRTFDIRLADGARLLAVEAVLLGRSAMGEHTPFVHLRDRWRVWKAEDMIFADDVRLDQTGRGLMHRCYTWAMITTTARRSYAVSSTRHRTRSRSARALLRASCSAGCWRATAWACVGC